MDLLTNHRLRLRPLGPLTRSEPLSTTTTTTTLLPRPLTSSYFHTCTCLTPSSLRLHGGPLPLLPHPAQRLRAPIQLHNALHGLRVVRHWDLRHILQEHL